MMTELLTLSVIFVWICLMVLAWMETVDTWMDKQEAINKAVARYLHSQEKYNAILSDKIQEHGHE